jgi:hypothetical protein
MATVTRPPKTAPAPAPEPAAPPEAAHEPATPVYWGDRLLVWIWLGGVALLVFLHLFDLLLRALRLR